MGLRICTRGIYALGIVQLALLHLSAAASFSASTREDQENYLRRFAYMGKSSPDPRLAELTNPDDRFRMAVRKFQMMAGINATGTVDEETRTMMQMPRCGVADETGMGAVTRKRRYAAQGSMWPKTSLTYRINNFTPDLPQTTVRSEIRDAFKQWSDVSPLTFTEVLTKSQSVDIDISFERGDHRDGAPFDGEGKTLAHAFFPQFGGDAHFDDDEKFTSRKDAGINFLQVAIHEFGHSLGLGHSDIKEAIMAPFYRKYDPNVRLHSDDIEGITYIYGQKRPQTTRPPTTTRRPFSRPSGVSMTTEAPFRGEICKDAKVDAMFAVNNDIYLFKGNVYYKLDMVIGVLPGYPKPISSDWPGLPDNIDTAFYYPAEAAIYFFKGDKFYKYNVNRRPTGSNPQTISSRFYGVPSNLDAAFIWSGNGRLYFIKGEDYYRMSRYTYLVDPGYPSKLKYWKGLPSKIDAAFNYTNGRTYFFSGSNYYRFNDVNFQVDSGYPKPTASWWLHCDDKPNAAAHNMNADEMMKGRDQFMTSGVNLLSSRVSLGMAALLTVVWQFCKSLQIHF